VSDVRVAPSLLSADFADFGAAAEACRAAGAELLHFDVMDGAFVPNITFGPGVVRALRPRSDATFDVHLMIEHPERWIGAFAEAGADILTVQAEACLHLQRTLAQIRASGMRAGLALNPATTLHVLQYILEDLDMLLVMTVNPGFGGQAYIPAMTAKVAEARAIIAGAGRDIWLEVDGGITEETAPAVVRAGANVLVAGSSLFNHPDGLQAGVRALREACLPD